MSTENQNQSAAELARAVVESQGRSVVNPAIVHETFAETVARQNRQGVRYAQPTLSPLQFEALALTQSGFDRKAVADWGTIKDQWTLARVQLVVNALGKGSLWMLMGSQGVGKSTTAALMARRAFRTRLDVLCIHWPVLVRQVISTYSRSSELTAENVLARPYESPFLVIEDLQGTDAKSHELHMLVAMVRRRADNGRDTVFCSEATMQSVEQILGSAIVARANQQGGFIHFTGPTKRV